MSEATNGLASTMFGAPDGVPNQNNNSSEENADHVDVDDKPRLILQDTIVYQKNGTIANVFDSVLGLELRAEGALWVENAEKYKFKRPNGTQCQVQFQMYSYERDELGAIILYVEDSTTKFWIELKPSQKYVAHFTSMVESAELKHFVTDYYERVLAGECKDDLVELCWEYAREDGRGLLQDDVIEVLTKDANAFFLLSAFREEILVDRRTKGMKWSNTEIYQLLRNECSTAYDRANTHVPPGPEPMTVDSPIIPDPSPVISDGGDVQTNHLNMLLSLVAEEIENGTPVKKITLASLWNRLYIKTKIPDYGMSAGPRTAKCIVYKIGCLLADTLEKRHPDLFLGSKFTDGLREVGRTRYPPYTKHVLTDAQWQEYMDSAEGLYLVRRNPQHEERAGANSVGGSTKLQVKDIFTGELAPPRPIGRVGGGRVGRPPKNRNLELEFYEEEEEDENGETSSRFDIEAPLTVESAWQRVWELGGEEEIISGRVVPSRIKRADY
ncbi:423ee925-77b4-4aa9-80b1-7a6f512d01eb [Sclerotinia trifoliorum]|uniref:423ee925-77b4-4aa9-80b1-7a6f512d01eb n=1 Tax=Sclerotinia trifoliorum TaxID=28548 RepID=A0A8H2VS93_9HELO|nr:423ee925-77b4-4aa9-80b1-7a6f512d01eb [Sclerotinia trifoliorum]